MICYIYNISMESQTQAVRYTIARDHTECGCEYCLYANTREFSREVEGSRTFDFDRAWANLERLRGRVGRHV